MQTKRNHPGIRIRHSRSCLSLSGGDCSAGRKDGCRPSFEAWVFDRRSGAKVRKTFPTPAAAKSWRSDALSQLNRGRLAPTTRKTLREAAEAWQVGAEADPPVILTRSGRRYKPSVLRGYEADLRNYVLPELGGLRLADVRRGDLQALVDQLLGRGLSASKVRNVLMPVRAIYRHAIERDEIMVNPTSNLRLPTDLGRRDRVAAADEAAMLLAALPEQDRALWATAFYGGLRLGELQALRWDDVDLASGVICVERGWDAKEGPIEPKSWKGTRRVPITGTLRDYLTAHKALSSRDGGDFVFGSRADRPFTPSHIRKRAANAWHTANADRKEKGLELLRRIGLHECRHTFVSLMFDAGLSLERIGDYVGHSSSYMTDRYRHLLEGHEAEAARLLDDYLARADTRARVEQLED
ncbi:MAG: site-specific integrase [Thermoleophilia bacterium]